MVRNLSAIRGGTKVLESVSCEFTPGEVLALIGPNGSGKSTLIDCLSGFLTAESGTISVQGIEIELQKTFSPYKHSICRTFQIPRIARQMTVFDQLLLSAENSQNTSIDARVRVIEVLEELQASGYAQDMGSNLSYGQQKIVEVARILLAKPSLVFLDEPLAGLAPHMRRIVMKAIQKMASNGSAVVIVEHDFPNVKEIAQRGYVLDEGTIFLTGTMKELTENALFSNLYIGI